jgi:hypothetical protein
LLQEFVNVALDAYLCSNNNTFSFKIIVSV